MLKVVITGPESSGKSTLTKQLANHFNAPLVKEYAREYITKLKRPYNQADLSKIAEEQIQLEELATKESPKIFICDTSLEVIKIWSEYKYGSCDSFIKKQMMARLPNLYLLMTPDIPWQSDPLRENPQDRMELFNLYKKELTTQNIDFAEICGKENERLSMAIKVIESKL